MMANPIPPMPLKMPLADEDGMISRTWISYFQAMFNRMGGTAASSNSDLTANVTALQASIAALNTGLSGLGQGRAL